MSTKLHAAVKEFLDAPRSEHLAVRLNDAEMAAVEKMRAILARPKPKKPRKRYFKMSGIVYRADQRGEYRCINKAVTVSPDRWSPLKWAKAVKGGAAVELTKAEADKLTGGVL